MQRLKINNFIPHLNQRNFIRRFAKDIHSDHQHKEANHGHEHKAHDESHDHGHDHHHVDPASLGYGPHKAEYTEYHMSPHWRGTIGTYFNPLAAMVITCVLGPAIYVALRGGPTQADADKKRKF